MAAAVTPRGSSGLSPIERVRQHWEAAADPVIDWDMWRSMATVELGDALVLSVGCSPDSMPSQYSATQAREFAKRLRVAESHRGPGGTLPLVPGVAGDKQPRVRLPDFAAWALSLNWQLPESFPEPNGSAGAKTVTQRSEGPSHTEALTHSGETTEQRRARLLAEFEAEHSKAAWGALARVASRDGRTRQTVSEDIKKARKERAEAASGSSGGAIGAMARGLTGKG
jgi:hypothetical protein